MNNFHVYHTSSPIFDTVLALLRSAIWGETRFPFRADKDTDWEAVYRELRMQTVHHLPVDLLAREDPERKSIYTQCTGLNIIHWYKVMQLQQDLCHQLYSAGIPCAVVKGAAAACYYPQPANRVMGDIDLLVDPEQFDRACQIVSADAQYFGENYRHKEYIKNGITIELHRAFGTLRKAEKNQHLDRRLFSAISAAKSVATDNFTFFSLPTVENGLVLLLHIDVHMENGLGLRQIIDWMMFVENVLTEDLWHSEFEPFLNQLERKTLAVTVTRMCQMYLGLRSDISWCSDADEQLCTDLMEYIFLQGNFGNKTQKGLNRTIGVLQASKNKLAFLKILQNRGCQNWKAITRYPFLKPLAWLYQLIRYLYYGLRSENTLGLLRNAHSSMDSKTRLMKNLGVSNMSDEG